MTEDGNELIRKLFDYPKLLEEISEFMKQHKVTKDQIIIEISSEKGFRYKITKEKR